MEGNIAFKAFLYKDKTDSPAEVRWFYMQQNAIVSFQNVKEKLQTTFPCLKGNNYTLSWKDCDDDMVAISSDAELLIALTNIRSKPRCLYIHIKEDAPTRSNPTVPDSAQSSVLHQGVICDSCNGEIYGFRYKCIECPDFDLCITCEVKKEHPEHWFIRITDPASSYQQLRKYLSHQLGRKIFTRSEREPKPEEKKHYKHHGPARRGWIHEAPAYNKTTLANKNTNRGQGESAETPKAGSCPYSTSYSTNIPSGDGQNYSANDVHFHYLKNIGQTIANLLDPLGIDVDIDVRTRSTPASMATENVPQNTPNTSANPPGTPETTPATPETTPANDNKTTSTENQATQSEPTAVTTEQQNCNRAVPVFPTNFIPVYTTCSAGLATPIVSAFVNPTAMETENGWTLLDENETQNSNTSSATSFNGTASDNNEKQSDANPNESQPKPAETNNANSGNGNGNTNASNNTSQQQQPTFGASTHNFMGFPEMPFPPPPQPGFNFDHMARELQKHIQTHFKGAMEVAETAATVASNVARQAATSAMSSAMNSHQPPFTATSTSTQNNPTANMTPNNPANNQSPPTTNGAVPKTGTESPNLNWVYPHIPQDNVTAQAFTVPKIPAPSAPPQAGRKNEAVSRGLETMLAMGFNNDGGWLTTVLECTSGDVTKALDLLQPVKK